jgi:hypothetical protein
MGYLPDRRNLMGSLPIRMAGDPLPWLLQDDSSQPGVRYFTLRDLLGKNADDPEVRRAQAAVMTSGPVPAILQAQQPEGYWVTPGGGALPRFTATLWQVIWLAELGADGNDERVRRGCEYVMAHSLARQGAFSVSPEADNGKIFPCMNAYLCATLLRLGYPPSHPVLARVLERAAEVITGGNEGPDFSCSENDGLPCAWGAAKNLKAFALVPAAQRTPRLQSAIQAGAAFLLSRDPAVADYPTNTTVSPRWFALGFPLAGAGDILETLAALADLGYGAESRLKHAWQWLLEKQDGQGRWKMEQTLKGDLWMEMENLGSPSKWVTLRVLRALNAAGFDWRPQ